MINPADATTGVMVVIGTIVFACALGAIGVLIADGPAKFRAWRRRRRRLALLRMAQPSDPRFLVSVAARDWKDAERAAKYLREAA